MALPAPKARSSPRPAAQAKSRPTQPAARGRKRLPALTMLRRSAIVEAALRLFSRNGYDATRAEDIAQAAGIAKGTLYLYFRSKEAIYAAAIAHAVEQVQRLTVERTGAAASFHEKLSAAISVRLHFWAEHGQIYRLLMTLGRQDRHRRQTNTMLRAGQQQFLDLFTEGVRSGALAEADYGALAWSVFDMLRGATERRLYGLGEASVEADAEAITSFALRALG